MRIGNYIFGTPRCGRDPVLGSFIKFAGVESMDIDLPTDETEKIKTIDTVTTSDSSGLSNHPALQKHNDSSKSKNLLAPKSQHSRERSNADPSKQLSNGDKVQITQGVDKGKIGRIVNAAPKVLEVLLIHRNETKYFFPKCVKPVCASPVSSRLSGMVIEVPTKWDDESTSFEPQSFLPVGGIARTSSKSLVSGNYVDVIGGAFRGKRGKVMYTTADRVQLYLEDVDEVQNIFRSNVQRRLSKPVPVRFGTLKDPILASRSSSTISATPEILKRRTARNSNSSFVSTYSSLMTGPQPRVGRIEPRHGFKSGDYIHVVEGMYKNKTGRVLKATPELVQVRIGVSNCPCYLSPLMLRKT